MEKISNIWTSPVSSKRINLFKKFPFLKKMMKSRAFQLALIFPSLILFYVIILAGFFGTPVGNRNIAIVFVWIFWWFLLIAIMVPFASRIWCTMCPLPFFGELSQRLSFLKIRPGKTGSLKTKYFGFNWKWPKILKNIWLQNIGFLMLCSFSAILVTRPIVSASMLLSLIIISLILAVLFRLRAFCSYVCPVGGFLSLYSMTSTLEVRSEDKEICKQCKSKSCITGNEKGYGCPWFVYVGNTERNNYCGLCMECVKSCDNDNIALNLRPFATETKIKGYDEAWKGFIMISLAMAYSVILLGTNGTIKDWANVTETGQWLGFLKYAGILWGSSLVLLPAIFYLFSYLSKRISGITGEIKMKEIFLGFSYMLIPLGLLAWIAFSVPLIFVNGSYIISVISDPFGWGWNLFGTTDFHWSPLIPEYLVYIQIPLLLTGLYFAISRGVLISARIYKDPWKAFRGLIPMAFLALFITLVFLTFFVG
jgi:polyferredoxin